MKRLFAISVLAASAFAAVSMVAEETQSVAGRDAHGQATAAAAAPAPAGAVERGRYLVESVGMCGQCHTPRNDHGQLQMDRWLQGGPVPAVTPPGYAKWAYKAPRIAGLPQHTDEQFVLLLTTGVNRDGKEPMPPMPPFRMTEADALAIAAYLRSLP